MEKVHHGQQKERTNEMRRLDYNPATGALFVFRSKINAISS
jgi:hypothetical protein